MKKILFVLVSAMVCAGCVPAAVGGVAVGGAVGGDNRNFKTQLAEDPNAAHQANNALRADKDLVDQANVCASVYNHNLLLVGQAPTEALRARAVDLVRNVRNVTRVFDQIQIAPPIGMIQRAKDAAITSNIKARMLATTDLKSNQFKIVTENGTVYMMGLTTHAQADKAAEVARHSAGVNKVVKLVEYLD